MSFGKMNVFIEIASPEPSKDAEGFVTSNYSILARVRAYFEQKNSTEKWLKLSQITSVNAMFRLRVIPGLELTTKHYILCNGKQYDISSVENVKNRGMYLEVLGSERQMTREVQDG